MDEDQSRLDAATAAEDKGNFEFAGLCYFSLGDSQERRHERAEAAGSYAKSGYCYRRAADKYRNDDEPESAIECFEKAGDMYEKAGRTTLAQEGMLSTLEYAKDAYRKGRVLCQHEGDFANAQPLFVKEMRAQHRFYRVNRQRWRHLLYWLWSWSSSYGQSWSRWLCSAALIVLVFTTLFTAFGINHLEGMDEPLLRRAVTSLYFSIATATTVGFGDIHAISTPGKLLVCIEMLLGFIVLGGLVTIIVQKVSQR